MPGLICKNLNEFLQGNLVFVGSISHYIQGYKKTYNDIDVSINIDYIDKIKEFGTYIPSQYKTVFQYPILEQFVVLYDDIIIDVFVREGKPDYIEIDGMKYSTLKDDIVYFNQQNKNDKYIQDKLYNSIQLLKKYENT